MWLAFLLCFFSALAAPPPDWQSRIDGGQMVFAPTDADVLPSLRASIGNGYIATVVGSDTVYIAGLFNGAATTVDPSHRARLQATNAFTVGNSSTYATALDLEYATYYRRSQIIQNSVLLADVEQRWYACQNRPNVMVMELQIAVSATFSPFALSLTNNQGIQSTDVKIQTVVSGAVTQQQGSIITPELPGGEIVQVALVFDTWTSYNVTGNATLYFITAVTTSIESSQPLNDAIEVYQEARANVATLWSDHVNSWAKIWQSGIEIEGRPDVAVVSNSSLYYILSSVRPDRVFSLSPGSLSSNGYNGHAFWDCETWMYPSLLLLQPTIAASLLEYRSQRLDQAKAKAQSYNPPYAGAMIPWESAFTGAETCPTTAGTGLREQHISGDVAFAARQYWQVTGDKTWLSGIYPLISSLADFWVSKASMGGGHITDIIPPDEYADHVNDSVYTNYVAIMGLQFAIDAATTLGLTPNPDWNQTANSLTILFDQTLQIHPEYQGYNGQTIKQADVVLLGYPLLYSMDLAIRKNDLDYYAQRTDSGGPAMTWGMHAIGYLELGEYDTAASNFNRSFANAQQPYLVWTETPTGGTTNFITGAGGYLQGVVFGYPGIRIRSSGLEINPTMIEGATSMKLRGLWYYQNRFDLSYTAQQLTLVLKEQLASASSLSVLDTSNGKDYPFQLNQPLTFTLPLSAVLRIHL